MHHGINFQNLECKQEKVLVAERRGNAGEKFQVHSGERLSSAVVGLGSELHMKKALRNSMIDCRKQLRNRIHCSMGFLCDCYAVSDCM